MTFFAILAFKWESKHFPFVGIVKMQKIPGDCCYLKGENGEDTFQLAKRGIYSRSAKMQKIVQEIGALSLEGISGS